MKTLLKGAATVLNVAGMGWMVYVLFSVAPDGRGMWAAIGVMVGLALNITAIWAGFGPLAEKSAWRTAQYRRMKLEEERKIAELEGK